MIVTVNGEPRDLPEPATIADALAAVAVDRSQRGVAVAVDAEVVPRSRWSEQRLQEGARVEVVAAIQGG
jgi:sulfur carrier protein